MNVLVIPEDFRKDQHILKPIITALFDFIGKPRANVRVCQNPLLGGIDQATNRDSIAEIIARYKGMVQIFLLLVDRDAVETRRAVLTGLEQMASNALGPNRFYAENAWQELEVWTLAGHDLPAHWQWREVRAEPNPKERYFEPFAQTRGVSQGPGGGRKALSEEAAGNIDRLRNALSRGFRQSRQSLSGKICRMIYALPNATAAKSPNLKKRTLANLHNQRPTWPSQKLAHQKLDRAVLAAYHAIDPEGRWSEDGAPLYTPTGTGTPLPPSHPRAAERTEADQKILANLLRLNHQRVISPGTGS